MHRNKQCNLVFHEKYWKKVSREGIDMVLYLTREDPNERPSATDALMHRWLHMNHTKKSPQSHNVSPNAQIPGLSPESGVSRVLMQRLGHRKNLSQDSSYLQTILKRSEESKDMTPFINTPGINVTPPSTEARKILVKLQESDNVVRHQRSRSNWMDPSSISNLNCSGTALSEFTPLKPTTGAYSSVGDKLIRKGSGSRNSPLHK
jgi:hypothetical protein